MQTKSHKKYESIDIFQRDKYNAECHTHTQQQFHQQNNK